MQRSISSRLVAMLLILLLATQNVPVFKLEAAPNVVATFNQTIDLSGTNDEFIALEELDYEKAREVNVSATFDAADTNKKVVVKLNRGLDFASLPGLVLQSDGSWQVDMSTLSPDLRTVISQIHVFEKSYTAGSKKRYYGGSVEYSISDAATGVNLSLTVKGDLWFAISKTQTFVNPLEVTVQSSSGVLYDHKLEKFTYNNTPLDFYSVSAYETNMVEVDPTFYPDGNNPGIVRENTLSKFAHYMVIRNKARAGNHSRIMLKDFVYKFKMDKNLDIQGVNIPMARSNYFSEIGATPSPAVIDTTTDPNYDIVTLTFGGFYDKGIVGQFGTNNAMQFEIEYKPKPGTAAGNYKDYRIITGQEFVATDIEDNVYASRGMDRGINFKVRVAEPSAKELLEIKSATKIWKRRDGTVEDTDAQFIGQYTFLNNSKSGLKNKIKISNIDPKLQLKAHKLIGTATAIKVVDNTGGIHNLAGPIDSGKSINLYHTFNVTDTSKYITEIEYISTTNLGFESIYMADRYLGYFDDPNIRERGGVLYGKIVTTDTTSDYTVDMTVTNVDTPAVTETHTMRAKLEEVTAAEIKQYLNIYKGGSSVSQVDSGDTVSFNARAEIYSYHQGLMDRIDGINLFIREADIMDIDPSTIKIYKDVSNLVEIPSSKITISKPSDNSGKPYYHIIVRDKFKGYDLATRKKKSFVYAKFDAKIKNGLASQSVDRRDIFFTSLLERDAVNDYTTYVDEAYFIPKLNTEQWDKNRPTSYVFAETPYKLIINKVANFYTGTSINYGSGTDTNYDYSTGSGQVVLGPADKVKYKVDISNNTGKNVEGFETLIPIPKANQSSSSTGTPAISGGVIDKLQPSAFGWTVNLKDTEPVYPSNYTAKYSTNYTLDKDSADWQDWSAIADKKTIKMIKVSRGGIIPDSTNESFEIEMKVPLADASTYAGKVNTFSSRIYTDIEGNAGYSFSNPVSMKLQTGVVEGYVFVDKNSNGLKDNEDIALKGVKVEAIKNDGTVIKSVTTDATTGKYVLNGMEQTVNLKVTNNSIAEYKFLTGVDSSFTPDSSDLTATKLGIDSSLSTDVNIPMYGKTILTIDSNGDALNPATLVPNVTSIPNFRGNQYGTLPVATRDGYDFVEWNTKADGTGTTPATSTTLFGAEDTTIYAKWAAKAGQSTYKVEHYKQNSTDRSVYDIVAADTATINSTAGENVQATPMTTYTGYTFDKVKSGTLNNYVEGVVKGDNSLVLKLYYSADVNTAYKVEHYKENPSNLGNYVVDATATDNLSGLTGDEVSATAKTFTGYTHASTHGSNVKTGTITDDGTLVLKLYYNVNKYSITFDGNGSTSGSTAAMNDQPYSKEINLTANGFAKTGYIFTGWNTLANGSGTNYADKGGFSIPTTNTTLYAQWAPEAYAVHYNGNGGQGSMSSLTGDINSDITISANSFTKLGYTFANWNTKADGTGTTYAAGASFTLASKNNILYAQWTKDKFTVSFDKNHADATGTTAGIPATAVGTPVTLTKNGFSRAGQTFAGWNTKADGTGIDFADEATFLILPANTTLYAKWEVSKYTVSYDANGGTGTAPSTVTVNHGGNLTVGSNALTKVGHTPNGWLNGSIAVADGGTISNITSDIILKADFTVNKYNVTFDANTGTGTTAALSNQDFGSQATLTANAFTKAGHRFVSWNTKSDGTGQSYADKGQYTIPASNTTLFAQWEAGEYTVVYDANGGTGTAPSSVTVNHGGNLTVGSNALTKVGHTPNGWLNGSTAVADGGTISNITSDIILKADFTVNKYNVTFDANGGTGTTAALSNQDFGSQVTLTANAFTRDGYVFVGWGTDSSATTAIYSDGGQYTIPASDTTLYAIWSNAEYAVRYNANGGTGTMPITTGDSGQTVTLASNAFEKTGYTFTGWNTIADGSGDSFTDGAGFVLNAKDNVLYAQWSSAGNVAYKVEHYKQNTDGSYPSTPTEFEDFLGATGERVSANAKSYAGYVASVMPTGVVLADGSLVLKAYYELSSISTVDITVVKKWSNVPAGTRPIAVIKVVGVATSGSNTANSSTETVNLIGPAEDTHTFTLPAQHRFDDGSLVDIVYDVEETPINNYNLTKSRTGDVFTLVNTYSGSTQSSNMMSVSVSKVWSSYERGTSPTGTITLYRELDGNVTTAGAVNVSLTNISHTWFVPISDSNDKAYNYRVEETNIPSNYSSVVSGSMSDGFVVTNTYAGTQPIADTLDIRVTAHWRDVPSAIRPSSRVVLKANGVELPDFSTTLSYDYHNHVWNGVPEKDSNGNPIVYSIEEKTGSSDYNITITGDSASGFDLKIVYVGSGGGSTGGGSTGGGSTGGGSTGGGSTGGGSTGGGSTGGGSTGGGSTGGGSTGGGSTGAPARPRPDESSLYKDIQAVEGLSSIDTVNRNSYMFGYPDNTFRPDEPITRVQLATILSRLLKEYKLSNEIYKANFTDVSEDAWYNKIIGFMQEKDLLNGYPDGSFKPDLPITRAELADLLSRFDDLKKTSDISFNDFDNSHWAARAINIVVTRGWLQGYPDGSLKPDEKLTRAETVTVINRMLNRKADVEFIRNNISQIILFKDVNVGHWAFYDIISATNSYEAVMDKNGKEIWKKITNPSN